MYQMIILYFVEQNARKVSVFVSLGARVLFGVAVL